MNRRSFLAATAALALAPSAFAEEIALHLEDAAAYSRPRRGVSLLVMHRGRIVFEDYPSPGAPDRGWELASGTKSFTGVMAAAAVKDRLLDLDEPAAETLPEWRSDPRKRRITIHQLLSLESGLQPGAIGRPPTYAAALEAPAQDEPGTTFAYGPAPFQIFGEIMRRKTNSDPLNYLTRRIFDPLHVAPTDWRRGADGMPFMPQGAQFTARDWARFGDWVRNGGGDLVDRAALAQCFVPSHANPGYGMSWWLLRPGLIPPARGAGVEVDAAMSERYGTIRMAAGAGDQRLYLIPGLDLVVARQADQILRGMFVRGAMRWSDATFLRALLGS
ncbi:MAG: beta-lactamase family protein [Proteobacteria bacterium]|nr:beta-lactamase family protein [Pseudomonadota bacterium]